MHLVRLCRAVSYVEDESATHCSFLKSDLVRLGRVIEFVEGRPAVPEGSCLGCSHGVHARKGGHMLKQLVGNHAEGVDVHFEVVGLMPEHLRGHIPIGASLPCQSECCIQVVAGMLVDRQRLGEAKVSQLDCASVIYQAVPVQITQSVRRDS